MIKTSSRLRGLAGRRAGRVVALLAWLGIAAACAVPGPSAPGGAAPSDPARATDSRAPARGSQPAKRPTPPPKAAPRKSPSAPAAAPKPGSQPDPKPDSSPGQAAPPTPSGEAPSPAPAIGPQANVPAEPAPRAPDPAAPGPGGIPDVELTRELLYQILASEIAAQRGEYASATATYLNIAQETRDPRLARRATELALAGRSLEAALPAAQLWYELEPGSMMAEQTLETLWLSTGRFVPAEPLLERRLVKARETGTAPQVYQRLQGLLTRVDDKSAALDMLSRIAAPDARLPSARLAMAAVAFAAGNSPRALAEAKAAMKLAPADPAPAIAAARYAHQGGGDADEAIRLLAEFLERNPKASEARFMLARLLVADGEHERAREQFEQALAHQPDDPTILFSLGQLAYQTGQLDAAHDYFGRYVALPESVRRDNDPAYLFLGQIAEDRRRYAEAVEWYSKVAAGEQHVPALVRRAISLGKLGRVDEARELLRTTSVTTQDDRLRLTLAESQVLRDADRHDDAFAMLGEAIERQPDNADLLYDQAMVAEKLDRLDVLEKNLRRIIALRPDHAHAYNALGYTLADRGQRLEEARTLIAKALELSPDDAHIEDSMGWVLFRLGRLDEAERFLRRAYGRQPEAEIAAHLGEVLWAQGRHDEARKLWQEARGREPDNATLRETLARLQVRL